MAKNTTCLWYDKDAEAAGRFYAETFPDSAVGTIQRASSASLSYQRQMVFAIAYPSVRRCNRDKQSIVVHLWEKVAATFGRQIEKSPQRIYPCHRQRLNG